MAKGHEVAKSFYDAFNRRDAAAMNAHYAPTATFTDPAFPRLDARETKGMWEMLCASAKNFGLTYEIIDASDTHANVEWIATYDFSRTGRRVVNHVSTRMDLEGGRIVRQLDRFDFPRWARQAFGPAGIILGHLPPFRGKVRATAREGLDKHLASKG